MAALSLSSSVSLFKKESISLYFPSLKAYSSFSCSAAFLEPAFSFTTLGFSSHSRNVIISDRGDKHRRTLVLALNESGEKKSPVLLTCRQCKKQFDPLLNNESACRFHPAHYGGEVKRKWKSYFYHQVGTKFLYHSEETKAEWGEVENFWDCCGRNDPADLGCEIGPHKSYDDE